MLKLVGLGDLPHLLRQVLTKAEDRYPDLYTGTNQDTFNVQVEPAEKGHWIDLVIKLTH